MNNNNAHINYTLADIEKYLQGTMSAKEMHQMEKAALQDPFLADAMEGFEQANIVDSKEYLNNINEASFTIPEKITPNYTLAHIEDYLQKTMAAPEMHQLEKTALKDEFLADAVEGFEQTNIPVAKQHLHNITTTILGTEKEDAKVIAMPKASNNKSWLRIAAAIILMVGAGSTIWLVNKSNNTSTIAKVEPERVQQNPTTPKIIVPNKEETKNSTATVTVPDIQKPNQASAQPKIEASISEAAAAIKGSEAKAFEPAVPVAKQEVAALKDNTLNEKYKSVVTANDDKGSTFKDFVSDSIKNANIVAVSKAKEKSQRELASAKKVSVTEASNATTRSAEANTNARANTVNQLRGRVINAEGQGVPYATLNLNRRDRRLNNANGTISDVNGYFNLQAADTSLNAEVAVLGYAQQHVNLNANTSNTVVLQRAEQTLADEIVTTGYGTKRKQSEAILGTPVGGLKSFEEYVSKKKEALKKDSIDDEEYVESLVELEFDVDKLGKPYNISVVNRKDINIETTNKAIQIVKEGPAWIADKKKKKAKVAIKF